MIAIFDDDGYHNNVMFGLDRLDRCSGQNGQVVMIAGGLSQGAACYLSVYK